MAFDSWQAFWQMGKHGIYVWSAYGFFVFGLGYLCLLTLLQRRAAMKAVKAIAREKRA